MNTIGDKTRQDSLSCLDPISNSQVVSNLNIFETEQLQIAKLKLETGSRRDKNVLSCRQLCSHRRHGQDKTRQFCLVRVGGVNKAVRNIITELDHSAASLLLLGYKPF